MKPRIVRTAGLRRLTRLGIAVLGLLALASGPRLALGEERVSPPLENAVTWSTATEVDNFGFDVYRATEADGPFTRLTAEPIAGAGTSDEPHDYRFVDATIAAGQVYYYYVESISMSGERERFTPIFAAPAKGTPAK